MTPRAPRPHATHTAGLAYPHLLIDVGVDPLLAFQPLRGHPAQLLLGALVPLQQGAVGVLTAGAVRRGAQPVKRGLSTREGSTGSKPATRGLGTTQAAARDFDGRARHPAWSGTEEQLWGGRAPRTERVVNIATLRRRRPSDSVRHTCAENKAVGAGARSGPGPQMRSNRKPGSNNQM